MRLRSAAAAVARKLPPTLFVRMGAKRSNFQVECLRPTADARDGAAAASFACVTRLQKQRKTTARLHAAFPPNVTLFQCISPPRTNRKQGVVAGGAEGGVGGGGAAASNTRAFEPKTRGAGAIRVIIRYY